MVPSMKTKFFHLDSFRVAFFIISGVALEFAIILFFNRSFFTQDDSGISGYPLLKFLGQELLSGNDPFFIPNIWTSGNIWAEAQFGLLNPLSYLFFVLAALVDSVLINAILWKFFYTIMLVWATYRLMCAFDINQNLSLCLSLLVPISGYVLYFDLAAWGIELLGFAWLIHFWASVENYLGDKETGMQLVLPAWLLVSSGYPYALFPLVYLVPWFLYREYKKNNRISPTTLLLGLGMGSLTIATYLPSVLSSSVNSRADGGFMNTGAWTISLGRNLFGIGSPTMFPDLQTNSYPDFTNAPVFYLSIALIISLPFVVFTKERLKDAQFTNIVIPLFMTGIAMSLPSNFWMFRWPFRFLPVFAISMLLLLGWLLQNSNLSYKSIRFKGGISVVFLAFFTTVSMNPGNAKYHLYIFFISLVALVVVAITILKKTQLAMYLVVYTASICVLITQLWLSPKSMPLRDYNVPGVVSKEFVANHAEDQGNILQVADFDAMSRSSIKSREIWNEILLGSWPALSNLPIINSYSASGFEDFDQALCLLPNGSTCPEGFSRLSSKFPGYNSNLGEVLGINTVIVQISNQNLPLSSGSYKEWDLETCYRFTCKFERVRAVDSGSIAYAPIGLEVRTEADNPRSMTFKISGRADNLLVRRLDWPGYSAKIGDADVQVSSGPAGLVELNLPDRVFEDEVLELTWEMPGKGWIRTSTLLSIVAFTLALFKTRRSRITSNF